MGLVSACWGILWRIYLVASKSFFSHWCYASPRGLSMSFGGLLPVFSTFPKEAFHFSYQRGDPVKLVLHGVDLSYDLRGRSLYDPCRPLSLCLLSRCCRSSILWPAHFSCDLTFCSYLFSQGSYSRWLAVISLSL